MPEVTAYAVDSPTGNFARTTITRREPGPTEIFFDIAYAGICHSDIHTAREEWGPAMFPLVPGHEIAGTVSKVGSEVTRFKVGDRVGVGCLVDSCGSCPECEDGQEQFCTGEGGSIGTYNSIGRDGLPTAGGYSTGFTVEERFALHIPDEIALEHAAPLLCAGITTYSPLKRWGAGPGRRVGVVGLGGLGHMAVQISAAMGAETHVLSRTRSKEADGLALGAVAYHATSEDGTLRSLRNSFDLLICTVSDGIDLNALLKTLDVDGALVVVGLPAEPTGVDLGNVIHRNRALAGSNIGGLPETQEMLDFCAEKGIRPMVEIIGGDEIDRAYDDVVASRVRYRFVIDAATLDAR
ncbi:NAD(P)-dependent alcohol dehydrogenase [Tessaracoccus sp. OS52]|uniref:NAD(P)-dependent alcohol dehydrogenase n=1 Tax=Tessaracoccus sp. OS52 TaxID=2886691 RepID=UPI001D10FACA|nr:NAD(P)-dependent alcohol dehydrogenase [Tessaracoccus sp. OS52]